MKWISFPFEKMRIFNEKNQDHGHFRTSSPSKTVDESSHTITLSKGLLFVSFGRRFISKKQIFNFSNNCYGSHFVCNFSIFRNHFLEYFLASFEKIHIKEKYLILPLQNGSDFHKKIKMNNSEASFNVNFSFEYFNNFDWFRQAVISTMIRSHFRS